ncbi:Long-chain-fatty-acid--CoA ligase [compost metagenome]
MTSYLDAKERRIIRRVALGDNLTRAARVNGQAIALVDGDERLSYAEFEAQANQFAHYLRARGLPAGSKVAMLATNSIEFLIACYGIFKAGLVWVPINHMLSADDVRYVLEHAEASLVLVDDVLHARHELRATLDAVGVPTLLLRPGRDKAETTPLRKALQGQSGEVPDVDISDNDLSLIMYTSGTTGRQKGVMHSNLSVHSALMSNVAETGIARESVCSAVLPLFHCAQFAGTASALLAGARVVLFRGFDVEHVMAAIERERITHFTGLPLMYAALLQSPARKTRDLSSLVECTYGLAPMARPMLERLIAELCPNFSLGTGQTEVFPVTARFHSDQQLKRFGSYWGQAAMVNDMAVMDDDGRLLGPGEAGEIVHRGPNVMLGYYKDPDATAAVSRFGWHHTGDLGMFDADRQLLFLDRKKDMVKTGGENVPSIKVEEVLLRHPAIANAAVVGLAHLRWGEAVSAFVVLRPERSATIDELMAYCRQHLGVFEVPKAIRVLQELPMTPTGKIQKHRLRTAFSDLYERDQGGAR